MHPIERALQPIVDDPEAFHREVLADLAREKGDQWIRDHAAELAENWKAAKVLLGL